MERSWMGYAERFAVILVYAMPFAAVCMLACGRPALMGLLWLFLVGLLALVL